MADPEKVAADNKAAAKSASTASTASTGTTSTAADANATGQSNGSSQQGDPTMSQDPNPELSVGGNNPNQGAPTGGEGNVTGTVGQDVNVVQTIRHPSETVGYSPRPAEGTGSADTNGIEYEQTVQRLAPVEHLHPMAQALGEIVNIPPGSRPMMVDPASGLGIVPPQQGGGTDQAKPEA